MDAPRWFSDNLAVLPAQGTVTVAGCGVNWLRWGDPAAPPVVLVHGGAAHARWWAPVAPFLARDHCVIAPDLSGMGDSGWRPAYRMETWADEVLAVARAAGAVGPAVLVGHSLGGTVVAVAGALHAPAVAAVVLCDVGVRRAGEQSRSARHFTNRLTYPTRPDAVERFKLIPRQRCDNSWLMHYLASHSVRPVGPGGPEDPVRPDAGNPGVTGWAWKFDWRLFARTSDRPIGDYLRQLGNSKLPVTCVNGEESRVVTAEVADRMRAALGRSVVELSIPDARHHLMLDQPIAFVTALRAALVRSLC